MSVRVRPGLGAADPVDEPKKLEAVQSLDHEGSAEAGLRNDRPDCWIELAGHMVVAVEKEREDQAIVATKAKRLVGLFSSCCRAALALVEHQVIERTQCGALVPVPLHTRLAPALLRLRRAAVLVEAALANRISEWLLLAVPRCPGAPVSLWRRRKHQRTRPQCCRGDSHAFAPSVCEHIAVSKAPLSH